MMRKVFYIALALLGSALSAAAAAAAAPAGPTNSAPQGGAPTRSAPASPGSLDALLAQSRSQGDEFLPPDQAFHVSAEADGPDRVRLTWAIAPGYYLYRDRVKFATSGTEAALGRPEMPEGQVKSDPYFGRQVVYHNQLIATLAIARAGGGPVSLPLAVTYQGCAEAGLCYPPITKKLQLELPGGGGGFISQQDRLAALIRSGNLLGVLGTFFGLGLLLAFTPCVLPMVPILSGLIAGQGAQLSTARAFTLSLTYVLGMAVTYTVAGAGFAAAGKQVQALFQQPWIIVLFALLFAAMAASMFGLFTVQMPAFLQTRLADASNRRRAGSYGGVALMGVLSALIVTSCVAPPLVATLTVIGQSGNVVRGASALFAMSLGMGTPLLVVGGSAGRLLPRAGAWMDTVKRVFGVMMLGMAAWMLTRIVPERYGLALFAVVALVLAGVLWLATRAAHGGRAMSSFARAGAVLAALYGAALLYGSATGATDPLDPLGGRPTVTSAASVLPFRPIRSLADLTREVAAASAARQPVMLDFYADWCTSCKEMERDTFSRPEVRSALAHMRLLRADVTANSTDDQRLLRHFQIYGPPTIAFYDSSGQERREFRVVGYMRADDFVAQLGQLP
jgi:thiol:disulfide interchange protein DsbD